MVSEVGLTGNHDFALSWVFNVSLPLCFTSTHGRSLNLRGRGCLIRILLIFLEGIAKIIVWESEQSYTWVASRAGLHHVHNAQSKDVTLDYYLFVNELIGSWIVELM